MKMFVVSFFGVMVCGIIKTITIYHNIKKR